MHSHSTKGHTDEHCWSNDQIPTKINIKFVGKFAEKCLLFTQFWWHCYLDRNSLLGAITWMVISQNLRQLMMHIWNHSKLKSIDWCDIFRAARIKITFVLRLHMAYNGISAWSLFKQSNDDTKKEEDYVSSFSVVEWMSIFVWICIFKRLNIPSIPFSDHI